MCGSFIKAAPVIVAVISTLLTVYVAHLVTAGPASTAPTTVLVVSAVGTLVAWGAVLLTWFRGAVRADVAEAITTLCDAADQADIDHAVEIAMQSMVAARCRCDSVTSEGGT